MQLAVSIPLIVCLVTSSLPLEAQVRMEPAAGPIARGIAREATRLTVDQAANSGDVEWSRVRRLATGTEILVTIGSARPVPRHVVAVDDSSLTLSNGRVVEHVARNDVAEIKTLKRGRGVWGHLGPLGGYFVGAFAGGYAVGLACEALQGRDRCDNGAFLVGAVMGGVSGGLYGLSAARRQTEEVIYGYKLVQ